jgi:hypothetical protein
MRPVMRPENIQERGEGLEQEHPCASSSGTVHAAQTQTSILSCHACTLSRARSRLPFPRTLSPSPSCFPLSPSLPPSLPLHPFLSLSLFLVLALALSLSQSVHTCNFILRLDRKNVPLKLVIKPRGPPLFAQDHPWPCSVIV